MASVRRDSAVNNERGWWKVETDIEELAQGATLEAIYTYAIRNESEPDYLSNNLISLYESNLDTINVYNEFLMDKSRDLVDRGNLPLDNVVGQTHKYGKYLGEWYYTGQVGANDKPVLARVETIEESINNDLTFVEPKSITTKDDLTPETDPALATAFTKSNTEPEGKLVEPTDETKPDENVDINTVVVNTHPSKPLKSAVMLGFDETKLADYTDYTKNLAVEKVLHSSGSEGIGTEIPSYSVEVTRYTTPSGSRDRSSVPGNMTYVFSKNNDRINAEMDEFWGERIIISKPTGEDRMKPLQIAVIVILSVAILGVGILPIRGIVVKK